MKTIDKGLNEAYKKAGENAYFGNGFKSGVEFAQKFIPISEELPCKQGHYLVIAPQSFPKNCKVVVAEFDFDAKTFYSESSDYAIKDATHWRCIDFL